MTDTAAIEGTDRTRIEAGLAAVERRIDAACERAGRDRREVTLLPVTKTVSAERVAHVLAAGYRDLGENRVQDARGKAKALAAHGPRWHLIGHLQRNKVKHALDFADCIQTIDHARLIDRISAELAERDERREVLLQVNTSGAASQYGVAPDEAEALAERIVACPQLEWTGLMTIGRFSERAEDTRDCFEGLRRLRDRLQTQFEQPLPVLSMGMSGDLEVAIEEGATLVRVGGAIFGARK